MTTVAGASRYLGASTLANSQGLSPSTPNILGASSSALNPTGLLDVGKKDTGIGLTGAARSVNSSLISQSRSGFNQIFSLNGVEFGTTETLVQKIAAIRASLPESRIAEDLRGGSLDEEA